MDLVGTTTPINHVWKGLYEIAGHTKVFNALISSS